MRALLRDSKSGRFYAPGWQWTAKREEACNFGGTFQALTFAEVYGMREVEVVLTFDKIGSDITIGLDGEERSPKDNAKSNRSSVISNEPEHLARDALRKGQLKSAVEPIQARNQRVFY